MDSGYHIFSGRIYKIGVIRFVDVPVDIFKQIGRGAHVPVAGTVEGVPLRRTLVSRGKGAYRLAIHSDIRKKLKMDTGAVVEVAFCRDEESREPELPPVLALGLRNSPKAQRVFRCMTTALRRQVVPYITAVKSQVALQASVKEFVARLEKCEEPKAKKAKAGGRKKPRK